jgi:hypothetical protein
MRSKLFSTIIIITSNLLLKKNQKKSLQTVIELFLINMSKPQMKLSVLRKKLKLTMLKSLLISIKKLKRRPTRKTPKLKQRDKFRSKMNLPMVAKTKSLLFLKRNQQKLQLQPQQLQPLQPPLPLQPLLLPVPPPQKKKKKKKFYLKTQKDHTMKKPSL